MRMQILTVAALGMIGLGLAGCERDTTDDGTAVEVEVDRTREDGTLDRVGEDIERGMERTGDEIQRGVDRTGEELDRATDNMRNGRRD